MSACFWIAVRTLGAGKTTPACLGVRKPQPVSRGFLELEQGVEGSPGLPRCLLAPQLRPAPSDAIAKPRSWSPPHATAQLRRVWGCGRRGVRNGKVSCSNPLSSATAPSLIPDLRHRARWRWVWHGARMPGSGLQRQLRRQGFCPRRPC